MSLRHTARKAAVVTTVAAFAVPAFLAGPANAVSNKNVTSERLQKSVKVHRVLDHLEEFQRIADEHDGNRAAGTSGYDASAEYVYEQLEKRYDVSYQEFEFSSYEQSGPSSFAQVSPTPTTYVEDETFSTLEYSGDGDVTGVLQAVDLVVPAPPTPGSTSGCEASDFAGFVAGGIALLQRGTCNFSVKVANAVAAGATGAVIFNEGQPGRDGLLEGVTISVPTAIPVLGVSYATGVALDGATVSISTETATTTDTTRNVIAESKTGNPDNVVMAGAHLDSVHEGPGINDNGTGSAALLEVAIQMGKVEPENKLRFAWWSAEEAGLVGSTEYVDDLVANDPEGLEDIALYLNYDMVGSPNYTLGIYDGDGSRWNLEGPEGSAAIEDLFADHFASKGLPSVETEYSGRSDYQAFINNDIPAGGLFTGAEVLKTAEEAEMFGGVAGVSLDPCYHQACDSSTPVEDGADADLYAQLEDLEGNVSVPALDANSDAIAHAMVTYAFDTSSVTGVPMP